MATVLKVRRPNRENLGDFGEMKAGSGKKEEEAVAFAPADCYNIL